MLGGLAVASLNHLLEGAEWARGRLVPHGGKHARIRLGTRELMFSVTADGYLAEALSETDPDVTITLPAPTPGKLSRGAEGLMQSAHLEGEVEFADALGFVLRHLRWGVEAALARLVGDIAAHRLHRAGQGLLGGLRRGFESVEGNLKEYVAEGAGTLPGRQEFEAQGQRMRRLRDALARLDKRLDRLDGTR